MGARTATQSATGAAVDVPLFVCGVEGDVFISVVDYGFFGLFDNGIEGPGLGRASFKTYHVEEGGAEGTIFDKGEG